MEPYDQHYIEAKWQKRWEETGLYEVDLKATQRPFYNLMMFPYPSAEGLHVGNVFAFTGSDIYGRFKRMQGYDVFEPMGFDAFGMHSENYAIQVGRHPMELVPSNITNFRRQLRRIGAMFDWRYEVDTTSPEYYKWSQWIFVQMYKAGLAYRKTAPVNWCPSCKTVLADEQVEGGVCERCKTEVTQREMNQWFFRIIAYAKRLLDNLKWIDWSEITKHAQEVWIGESHGAEIDFPIEGSEERMRVFTTRPDTIFGATYMVLAPEHPLVERVTAPERQAEIEAYVAEARRKDTIARTSLDTEKTGVFTGGYAINPATDERIPIWVADYVLMAYGTGAIMAVPGHDERDFEFARKFDLPIVEVISPDGDGHELREAYVEEGIMIHSSQFDGMRSPEAMDRITEWLAERGLAKKAASYRLHDWCISRQRYWGPPIPILYCDRCGTLPVPEEDLPVLLPETSDYLPDDTGKSPLARIESFVYTTCPTCGGLARRETDVSDNFLDSAWYFLRYPSAHREDQIFEECLTKKWLPVDMYIGGHEHAVLHLMYTRFITMVLKDLGYIDFEEPFEKFRAHGLIIKDGAKMSKSRGNVVNPDEYIETYGADVLRMYLHFLGPFDEGGDFSDKAILGISRFLGRVQTQVLNRLEGFGSGVSLGPMHRAIKAITEDIEHLKFNTAIAHLMEYTNWMTEHRAQFTATQWDEVIRNLVLLLAPFAPFSSEELWERLGGPYSVHDQAWPKWDERLLAAEAFTLVIQINGKLRDTVQAPMDLSEEEAEQLALGREKIRRMIEGKQVVKTIYVPRRLINLVVKREP